MPAAPLPTPPWAPRAAAAPGIRWLAAALAIAAALLGAAGSARAQSEAKAPATSGAAPEVSVESIGTVPATRGGASRAGEAVFVVGGVEVATLRAAVAGFGPAVRVDRAEVRIAGLSEVEQRAPVRTLAFREQGRRGAALLVGSALIFSLFEDDLEPGSGITLEKAGEEAAARLARGLEQRREQARPQRILVGIGIAIGATVLLVFWLWLLRRVASGLTAVVERQIEAHADGRSWLRSLVLYANVLIRRLVQILALIVAAGLVFGWLEAVLHAFPATAHHAERLGGVFGDLLRQIFDAFLSSIPGLLMVVLIVLIAQGVAEANKALFRAAAQGRVRLPGVHEETAGATRRIVSVLIWAFALVAMYPYLPGSDSEVFKGISVLLGAMLTLGSSGLVTQLMSGLVLIYARALRTGDYVVIGDTEGVVTEIGPLATKVMTMRNQEVTIPNNQVVSTSIVNYSKLATSQGTMISTRVTIGYDAPWRQVHAMLLAAASRTPGVRAEPAPRVMQRALADWYVEYELFCHIDRPLDRLPLLSALHAHVQDEFNEHGVQIMSPHFVLQPEEAVVVPRSRWYEKPASPPQGTPAPPPDPKRTSPPAS